MRYLVSGTMTLKFVDFPVEADSEEEALKEVEDGYFEDQIISDAEELQIETVTVTSVDESDEDE